MAFRDWEPASEYWSDDHDVAGGFYRPCMRDAVRYDRITGYFSSAIYLIVWGEIVDFAARGGKIRIICSPFLSTSDVKSIQEGYQAVSNHELAERILSDYRELLQHPRLAEPAKVLAGLIVDGIVDIRIAQVSSHVKVSSRAMFHDKTGLFYDDNGDAIGFRGGINETYLGLAAGGNVDSITVWTSWGGREAALITSNAERFERLWRDETLGVNVCEVPDIALEEFSRIASANEPWHVTADSLAAQEHLARQAAPLKRFALRPHQQQAIQAWERANRIGIFKHATATGKTFAAIEAIRRELQDGHRPVVLVPYTVLVNQWTSELYEHLSDLPVRVHPCHADRSEWKTLLGSWLGQNEENRIVVSTIATASHPLFSGHLNRASDHLFLVADEIHRLGARKAKGLFEVPAVSRLGLSATPERAGDPEGTKALLDYFGGIVDTLTLEDALKSDPPILTKYAYQPYIVRLSDHEQEEWNNLSRQIAQMIARYGKSEEISHQALQHPEVKRLLIKRARVIKKAEAKISLAKSIVRDNYGNGDRWLVYCEDQDHLRKVVTELLGADLPVTEYHSRMAGDRGATLSNFASHGGIIVSIRCFDECVDIPGATHALILASSRNAREFIQRRGRVLRKAEGKSYAEIYDTIVVPNTSTLDPSGKSMILGELARADEFSKSSLTKAGRGELDRAIAEAGGTLEDWDASGGFEDDQDEEYL